MFIMCLQHALFSCTITDAPSIPAEDESRSELVLPHTSLTEHQQNDQANPVRKSLTEPEFSCPVVHAAHVGANVANGEQLVQGDRETVPSPLSQSTSLHSKCTCCLLCVVWAKDEA